MLKMVAPLFVKQTLKDFMVLFSDFCAGLRSGSDRVAQATRIFLGSLINFVL